MMDLVHWVRGLPPELATFVIASLPISELRGAIPVALGVYDLPLWSALLWAILGNLAPIPVILRILEPVSNFLRQRSRFWEGFFQWLFARTRRRGEHYFRVYKELGLVLFVAVPLPITGAWTGSVAAFLFGLPPGRSFLLITLGVLIAASVVTSATLGVSWLAFLARHHAY
ncbi:MAG: small multi-drug export protein [candidate division NC10 bacterium]